MNKFGKTPAEVIGEFHPLFKSLLWVAAARSTDEQRPALNHIHVERRGLDYHIVATDGKRMHVSTFDPGMFDDDIENIEIGNYEVIAKSAKFIVIAANDENMNFPNWETLMPLQTLSYEASLCARTISKIGITTGTLLATDFVTEACGFGNGFKKDAHVTIEYAPCPNGGGFAIKHELGTAIVMPMKMDNGHEESPPKDDAEATPHIPGLEPAAPVAQTGDTPEAHPLDNLIDAMEPGDSMSVSIGVGDKVIDITKDAVTSRKKK